jgi:hypothetical protein
MKKIIIVIIGVFLFVGTIAGGNLRKLSVWSNAQEIGFNLWTLFCLVGIPYIIFLQFKDKFKKNLGTKEIPESKIEKAVKEKLFFTTNNNKLMIGVLVLIVIIFYWFGIRPENIRKQCLLEARKKSDQVAEMEINIERRGLPITKKADYEKVKDDRLRECLLEHGLAE